jgi:hemolysin activation/secretion protein
VGGGAANSCANHLANGGTRNWTALRYHVEAATLAGDWQVSGRLKGQLSGDALIAGEQFGLGGASSVRGFADRVTSGDSGYQWTLEGLAPAVGAYKIRPLVFLEGGRVSVKGGASDTLMSVGAGIRMSFDQWQLALDLAKVLDRNRAETRSGPVRMHFAASYRF